jgi:hypothetical protein
MKLYLFWMSEKLSIPDMKSKIDNILLEPEIRFCGLIDSSGELIVGDMRKGVIPFENDARRQKMFQELAHRVANRAGFDANLGRVKYSLVIAEPSVNIDRLGWKIIDKLGNQWSEFHGF